MRPGTRFPRPARRSMDRGGRVRARAAALLLLTAGPGLTACEDVTIPSGGVRGTWELTAVNGDPLPAIMFDGDIPGSGHVIVTAKSGTLTLGGATYSQRAVGDFEFVDNDVLLEDNEILSSGEYDVDGQILTFDPDQATAPDFTGTLQGDVLTTVETDSDFGQLTLRWER